MSQAKEELARIAAKAIIERMNRITAIWGSLDYYQKHKKLPADEGNAVKRRIDEMSRPELISFCLSIHPTIARLRKRIESCEDELKKSQWQSELKMRLDELLELQNIRDGII